MPRIRYLKPDFFLDEDIAVLPHQHRLAFQGLWCYADREGRLEDRPQKLKALIFPYEDADMDQILDDLTKKPFIHRYTTDKKRFIQIIQFLKHQKPHHTERPSEIPPPQEDTQKTVKQPLKDGDTPEGMGMGMGIRNGDGEKDTASPAFSDSLKTVFKEVYERGLNIYALMNRLNNDRHSTEPMPDAVIMRVCMQYLECPSAVKNEWAWFMRVLNAELDLFNANNRIVEHQEIKRAPVARGVAELIKTI